VVSGPTRRLAIAIIASTAVCWLLFGASEAFGASTTTDCPGLQNALNQAANGDTITLTELCTASNSGASAGHFSLPIGTVSFTLSGESGSGAGFDGTGVSSRPLSAVGNGTVTISNLVFKNATNNTPNVLGAALFADGNYTLTLDHDTFINNQTVNSGSGGAVAIEVSQTSGPITISNSTFRDNVAQIHGGAVLIINFFTPVPVTLSNDTFSNNSLKAGSSTLDLLGGALFVENAAAGTPSLTQTGNTFSDNSIIGGTSDANGGAEAAEGMPLTSTNDVFTGNSLRAAPATHNSEGAALSIENNDCNAALNHTATNLVVAGNSIDDGGTTANDHGALYLGCGEGNGTTNGGNNLTVKDSTISGNVGGGGTAGIFGDPIDQLTLRNTILAGDFDGAELTGFAGTGGTVTATFTDLCAQVPPPQPPFTGTGNICHDPGLVNAIGGNVRETSSSPTIDAGSNGLVPAGLVQDVYGATRIQAHLQGHPLRVDMGAAESRTILAPLVKITRPAPGAVFKLHQTVHSSFTCTEGAGGPGLASCKDGANHTSGGLVNTSSTGKHTYKVTATSKDGLKTNKTVTYTVKK
jgi:hypothetical protein